MPPNTFSLTSEQSQAVTASGRSVIVSAAAGSGKTAVLAERCAYLVCDAPPDQRCDVDSLLVLTFTDAAAAQMRSRIVDAIRRRLDERPDDARLRRQLALVDAAQISTVHAFCLWLVRRWFTQVGVEPTAVIMDGEEASLLKKEVLSELFTQLYATLPATDDPLGGKEIEPPPDAPAASDEALSTWELGRRTTALLGPAFVRLIDDYGLGEDRDISAVVLKVYEFTRSLPNPSEWLHEAVESPLVRPEAVVLECAVALRTELERQAEHCAQLVETMRARDPVGHFYAEKIAEYESALREWKAILEGGDRRNAIESLERFEAVRKQINGFEFNKERAKPLPKDADSGARAAREAASDLFSKQVKGRLFEKRLKKRFGLFSVEEWIAGLKKAAPYVATLVDVVAAFEDAYSRRKRRLNVLDFADLERFAHDLLRPRSGAAGPSEVARSLQEKFAHVLVDEFQDINPLQQAILHLVSREADPDRCGNLFVVGDVKQSIYRFRLAEPAIFTERLRRFSDGERGTAIHLQSNFRSRPEILDLVNFVFRRLMRPAFGELVYDASAELRPGRVLEENTRRHPVEMHLLEQTWQAAPDEEEEEERKEAVEAGVADPRDPARWTPIEREAYLIGTHIREWMASGEHLVEGEPLRYRDIAVLLRTAKVNAERMAAMFAFLGIPAYAEVGGSLFAAIEIRDVLAVLQLLDNVQQDIPLASVLRSGIMGERLNEDELVEIRCLDREIPFHEVVREYAQRGGDGAIRERMRALLQRINRYREEARRCPPADLLWRLYEEHGYMGYVAGLINGVQRRANLLKFHQIARKFGTFRRQGLHRFLRYIQLLEEEEQDVPLAPSLGESDDVVRVMSIHQSKGLEFPIAFVAGLGTKFNFRDRQGRIIFERKSRIGLRVVDTARMIEYPSAAHCLVADEIERSTREEELRILYTAMTRARDRLVLVGSMREPPTSEEVGYPGAASSRPLSLWSIAAAEKPLDWLLASTCGAPESVLKVHTHDAEEMRAWRACDPKDESEAKVRLAASRLEALPGSEPVAVDDPQVAAVLSRIDFVYPHLSATSVRATMAASEFAGAYDFLRDPDERPELRKGRDAFQVPPSKYSTQAQDPSVHRGVITHRVLQHLDFAVAGGAGGVASELQRLTTSGIIAAEDRSVVDEAGLAWFVSTPLAESIRRAGAAYTREFRFIAAEPLTTFDRSIDASADDRVLVRGIVDGILPTKDGLTLVDFKTDAISANEVSDRGDRYRPQMTLYASAMAALWKRPVSAIWLVFLAPRQILQCAADLSAFIANSSSTGGTRIVSVEHGYGSRR